MWSRFAFPIARLRIPRRPRFRGGASSRGASSGSGRVFSSSLVAIALLRYPTGQVGNWILVRRILIAVLVTIFVLIGAAVGFAYWQGTVIVGQLHAGPKAAVVRAVKPEL